MARLLWTLKQHVGPRARALHALTFDSRRNRALLFGGVAAGQRLGDTWTWDGENWTQVNDIGPRPRSEAALAWDSARVRAILFGGFDGNAVLQDTWEWNGEDWTQVADSGPDGRLGHVLVFDRQRSRAVLFGGDDFAGRRFADTWEWDGNEWVQVADAGPTARQGHGMVFDGSRNRVVLFGGLDASNTTLADTWEWDGTVWTQIASFGPPATVRGSLISTARRALLFGGTSALSGTPELFRLSWEWDGRHWTARQDMGPSARWGHAMVFDPLRNRGVLFGGNTVAFGITPPVESGETWEQFEEGGAAPPPPPPPVTDEDITVIGVATIPAVPVEGTFFAIDATLSRAPQRASVLFGLRDSAGNELIRAVELDANGQAAVVLGELALAAGSYQASAAINGLGEQISFDVSPFDADVSVASLSAVPADLPRNTPLTLTVTLNAPAPEGGLFVPLLMTISDGPTLVPGLRVSVAASQQAGSITIPGELFDQTLTQVTFTASLRGTTSDVTVPIV
jgi:hypothetical protein